MPRRIVLSGLAFLLPLAFSQCSPTYVVRAGIEEASILWSREAIEDVLEQKHLSVEARTMLTEVQRVSAYAERVGLSTNDSFVYYSEIDRDVLVWVLSATPKYELSFKTWWFPIVGHVPYKGFFEKEDALEALHSLSEEGYDAYVRPSLAFSTLGWFSDPLLSTMLQVDRVSLVDTVFHELLHNTLWIPNYVEYNESLANAVGAFLSIQYFREYYGVTHYFTKEAESRWEDEVRYSAFLTNALLELRSVLRAVEHEPIAEKDRVRSEFFRRLNAKWIEQKKHFISERYAKKEFKENNASLLAESIYLSQLWKFDEQFRVLNRDFERFLHAQQKIKTIVDEKNVSPFSLLGPATSSKKEIVTTPKE